MSLLLGCIADDFTGATDIANTLVKSGLRTIQLLGVPDPSIPVPDAEAVVVALKSRTSPVTEAVSECLASLAWLQSTGARQFFFKYCSTFDSPQQGNIGPVIETLLSRLDTDFTIACPAFPAAGRTVYQGHLFVFDTPLAESSMRDHPLTPMRDSNLVRVLGRQTRLPVGLVAFADVEAGPQGIRRAFDGLRAVGKRIAIVDALTDHHLHAIGSACHDLVLITGGSGVAMGLAENYRKIAGVELPQAADLLPSIRGASAVICGSCSSATRGQIAAMEGRFPIFRIDPLALAMGRDLVGHAVAWWERQSVSTPVIVSTSSPPAVVQEVQQQLGVMAAGKLVEDALAETACRLVKKSVRRLVIAGGETAGAVLGALGIRKLRIGPEIAPGVPCTVSEEEPGLALALKSGNFGGLEFFREAFEVMP